MFAEHPRGRARGVAETPAGQSALLGDNEVDRAIFADAQNVVVLADASIGRAVLDVGTEAADPSQDRFLCLGMSGDLAGQRKQANCLGQGASLWINVFAQRDPLWLFPIALLDVGAKPAVAQGDLIPRGRVLAQNPDARSLA